MPLESSFVSPLTRVPTASASTSSSTCSLYCLHALLSVSAHRQIQYIHLTSAPASVYSILGQIAWRLEADDCLPIRATKVAKYFIWSDVITFLIQSSGGGMQVQQSLSNIGSKVRTHLSLCFSNTLTNNTIRFSSLVLFCSSSPLASSVSLLGSSSSAYTHATPIRSITASGVHWPTLLLLPALQSSYVSPILHHFYAPD
jgi:hypothetical protein